MTKSYINSKLVIRKSKLEGLGTFAVSKIEKGEILFIKGGHIASKDKLFFVKMINSYLPIDDNFFIGAKSEEEEEKVKLYLNHSCNPNCGIRGEITFIAMRIIEEEEEITLDYAMVDNEDYSFQCNCDYPNCRRTITGFDWKKRDLQLRYGNYFSEYLKRKFVIIKNYK